MKTHLAALIIAILLLPVVVQAAPAEQLFGLGDVPAKLVPEIDAETFAAERFAVLSSELSPAVLVKSAEKEITFFGGMSDWGLGSPTYIALPTEQGNKVFARGSSISASMNEAWLLVWFNGAESWKSWDAPVLIVLQHKPTALKLSKDGLSLTFSESAGIIATMPLYGYWKVPLSESSDFLAAQSLPSKGIATDAWAELLPDGVVERCRFFSSVLRMYPVYCKEEYQPYKDAILVRESFSWLAIDDDWQTPATKLAPVPPTIALAWWAGNNTAKHPFPMDFSNPIYDPDLFTPYGPYVGIKDVDNYTISMYTVDYLGSVEEAPTYGIDKNPLASAVVQKLQQQVAEKLSSNDWQDSWVVGGTDNDYRQLIGDRWYAKSAKYLSPETKETLKSNLSSYFADYVLKMENFEQHDDTFLLKGLDSGSFGGFGEAGKTTTNLIETLWDVAYFGDTFQVVIPAWQRIKRFLVTPQASDWKSVGRYSVVELGEEAPPVMALARLSVKCGDFVTYAHSNYIFSRELIHHYVKQVGAEYFRQNQPFHSMEPMPKEVYLTSIESDLMGWQLDGPSYPKDARERQFNNRWLGFTNTDLGRFYYDLLRDETEAELDLLTARAAKGETPYKLFEDVPNAAPSVVRLRAMLLREPIEKLAEIAPVEKWQGNTTAMGVVFLNAFGEGVRIRVAPQTTVANFVRGLERDIAAGYPALDLAVEVPESDDAVKLPFIRWSSWKAPKEVQAPGGKWWSFGRIIPADFVPKSTQTKRLSWNTQVWVFE